MMMTGFSFWALAALASFFVGVSKGGLPLIGILAVPLLSLVISPVVAVGLLLPIYIFSDMYGLWIYRREYDTRNIMILVPAAAVGILIGWATARITNEDVVKLLVGVIGLAYCAMPCGPFTGCLNPSRRMCRAACSGASFPASQVL